VRIVAGGLQKDEPHLLVSLAVTIPVPQPQNLVACGNIDGPIGVNRQVHRGCRAFEKRGDAVRPAVPVAILHPQNPIVLRPGVILRSEVRMAFDHQQVSLGIAIQGNRVDNLGG